MGRENSTIGRSLSRAKTVREARKKLDQSIEGEDANADEAGADVVQTLLE